MKADCTEKEVRDFVTAADRLNDIVEGLNATRWEHRGQRLKDTEEWCAFYVALKKVSSRKNLLIRDQARSPGELDQIT